MVALAEALIILNLNFIPSAQLMLTLLRRHRDSINSEIEEELIEDFCEWLTSAVDVNCKLEFKTPQTVKSGARTLSRQSQDTDSDGSSDDDQRDPQTTARKRIRQRMTTKGNATARQGEENDEYVLEGLSSQGNKLKANR